MPVKPLPKTLILRLRRILKKRNKVHGINDLVSSLEKMKNIDHRKKWLVEQYGNGLEYSRVRQMNVSRNYPKLGVVIKKMHYSDDLNKLRQRVRNHNKRKNAGKLNYELKMPIAYSLGQDFVAMSKTNKPNLTEILSPLKYGGTRRGKNFFKELKKKHKITLQELEKSARKASSLTKLDHCNILLLGINKQGKFVFMPLVDVY